MVKCKNCGEEEERHIDYFGTGKKNVCPSRKSMKFFPEKQNYLPNTGDTNGSN